MNAAKASMTASTPELSDGMAGKSSFKTLTVFSRNVLALFILHFTQIPIMKAITCFGLFLLAIAAITGLTLPLAIADAEQATRITIGIAGTGVGATLLFPLLLSGFLLRTRLGNRRLMLLPHFRLAQLCAAFLLLLCGPFLAAILFAIQGVPPGSLILSVAANMLFFESVLLWLIFALSYSRPGLLLMWSGWIAFSAMADRISIKGFLTEHTGLTLVLTTLM